VTYSAFKKTIKAFLTPTDTLDDLKTQLNKYFMFCGEDQSTSHVFVQQPHYDLGAGEEDMWKTIYYPKIIKDNSDVGLGVAKNLYPRVSADKIRHGRIYV